MPKSTSSTSLPEGTLKYDDVVCLITGHDAEWSRRHSFNPGTTFENAYERVFEEIRRITRTYKEGVERAAAKAYPQESEQMAEWLYHPLVYLPVGHADAMAITLFDDLDPIHYVTAHCTTTVEEVAVGFAPLVASIVDSPWPIDWQDCLIDLKTFFRQRSSLPPLVMLTRAKLGAIGSIGRCLPFLEATYRAIVADCLHTLQALAAEAEGDGLKRFEITGDDLRATRIALLDLQGQEEVGLLVATSNYSIAGAILSRFQTLSAADVFRYAEPLEQDFRKAEWIASAAEFLADVDSSSGSSAADDGPKQSPGPEELGGLLTGGHALRWTRSSLAVTPDAFHAPATSGIKGFLELSSEINIAVGHQSVVDKCVKSIMQDVQDNAGIGPQDGEYTAQLLGNSDFLLHQSGKNQSGRAFLPVVRSIRLVQDFFQQVMEDRAGSVGAEAPPRHITGFSSFPTVPVPLGKTTAFGELRRPIKGHYPVLQTVLPVLRWRMVNCDDPLDPGDLRHLNVRKGQRLKLGRRARPSDLCPITLCSEPKKYLAPSSLLRTVQYLFQNYATLLANPYVFDSVIDLYDGFASLHAVLTKHLVKLYAGKDAIEQIPAEVIAQIARYVGALHRAMEHRLYRAFPEATHRDMDVDFRGGLNQLIFGADCLVKSAVGLVKRYINVSDFSPDDHSFNVFGVVNRIDFEPEIVTVSLKTGAEPAARLAIIRSDVPHLCVIASYLDFVHEVGHLAFDERRLPRDPVTLPLLPQLPILSTSENILAEIYSNALTTLLVARDIPQAMSKHLVANFSLTTRHGYSPEERLENFAGFFFNVFIVAHGIETCGRFVTEQGRSWSKLGAEEIRKLFPHRKEFWEYDGLKKEYVKFIDAFGPFCWDYDRIRGRNDADQARSSQFFRDSFDRCWDRVYHSFGVIMGDVIEFYGRYVTKTYPECELQDPLGAIADAMEKWFEDDENAGRPLYASMPELERAAGVRVDDTTFICAALRCALKARMSLLGEAAGGKGSFEVHVPLDQKTGKIQFPENSSQRQFSKYLIRPNDGLLFCCHLRQRGVRLRRQITLLKSLWHISSRMKEDRFSYLIQQGLSSDSASAPEKRSTEHISLP